jgi:beta-1,4-mannosyl-glycoprotein beta-1,4-N-acetylglucosaminyltransferase
VTVYDCCMFLNENDLFEIRLNQHWDFVDKFIVVEAGETHTGLKKPLQFDHKRFKKYESKLHYISFDNFESEITKYPKLLDTTALSRIGHNQDPADWFRDHFQGNYAYQVLKDLGASKDDIIYISCLDEIIKKEAFNKCIKIFKEEPISLGLGTSPIISFCLDLYAY